MPGDRARSYLRLDDDGFAAYIHDDFRYTASFNSVGNVKRHGNAQLLATLRDFVGLHDPLFGTHTDSLSQDYGVVKDKIRIFLACVYWLVVVVYG